MSTAVHVLQMGPCWAFQLLAAAPTCTLQPLRLDTIMANLLPSSTSCCR